MGKLVPKKPQHFNTIPSFETDVHKLIDTFVLKVKRIDETKFSIFKEVWRECSFSFIHQAVPLNVPAGDFLQLLYAVALNRLADPSPYLDYQADPGELTGTACGNAAPAEAEDAWGQRAGGVEVDAHLGTETRSGAGVEQRSPHQRAATGAAAVPIDARRSNSHIGKSSGAAGLAAAEEDPLDQECDLLAHIDELFGDLFQEQQVHHQNTLDQPFSMASHAPPLQNSGFGAAGNTANGGFLNVAPGAPPLPLHMLAGPQQHTTAARLSAGPYDALYEFQERVTLTPPLAGPELSFQATAAESPSLSQRQQQQQQFKGAEDLCAGCGLDTVALAGTAEGRVPQRHDQDVAPCTQLLPSALAARANGSLGTASGPGFVGRGLEEEDDYDGAIMADVPDKTSLLLSSTSWGIVQSATLQSAGLEPANVPNLKIQCNEPTEGSLPVPHQTHDHVEEVDNLMPMNGALDIQAAPAAVAPGSTPAVLMGSSCAELAPSTGSPGGCSNVVGAGPWGPGMESVDMDLSRHSSRTLNEVFSPMRSDAVVPSPLKGLASPLTKQATPELLPPTQSSLRGTPALRTLQTPSSLQLLHSQMHAPDRENNAVALSGGFGPDNLATELHTAAAADAYRFVAPTMPPNDGADVAKGSAGPGPHAMLADAQSFGWAVQGLPRSLWHPLSPQQQQHPPTLPYVMQAPPCGGAAQPISDPSDTAAPIWALTLAAAAAAAEDSARATGTGCTHTHMAEAQDTMMPKTAAACSTGADAGAILPGSSEALGAFADVGPPPQGSEAPNPNPQEQHSTLPAAPPLPGPDVPLAARVGAIYALYCLHATQICCPSVRIYVPLPLLRSMTGTVQEAAAAGLRDVVVIVRELWRQGALVPGGVACFNGSTSAPSSDKSHVWMAAAAGRAKAVAAGHGCAHKYLDASTRRLATFHDVLMSNPVLRQALLHLRTALPLLADMEGFERLCDLYGKQRTAVFQENGNGGDAGASCSSAPDVLFEARVGGDVRRMVRRMFAEVLRALRLPPPKIQRTEQKRRQRELEVQRKAEEAARLEAEMASGPRTVAEALAQVAAKPPAPLRRRVAGELGALMRRRAIQAGVGAPGTGAAAGNIGSGGGVGPTTSGSRQQRVTIIRHRSELASAGLLGEDTLRDASMLGIIPPRVLRAEEERRHRVQTVADTWLSRQDRLMRGDQGVAREAQQPQCVRQQRGDQPQKEPGKLTEGAAKSRSQGRISKDSSAAAPRSIRVPQGGDQGARKAKGDEPSTPFHDSQDDGHEKDMDDDFDVDAELEAAFAELETAVDPSAHQQSPAAVVATTAPGQTSTGVDNINTTVIAPSATGVRGRGRGGVSGRGRGARSNPRNQCEHDDRQGGHAQRAGKRKTGKQLVPTSADSPAAKHVDRTAMRPRKRLKGSSTEGGLGLPVAEESGRGYSGRTRQTARVDAEGARVGEMKAGGGGGSASAGDELEAHDLLEDLGIADAELIRQTQLALKAQREAMEILRRMRPAAPHMRSAAGEPPPPLLPPDPPAALQPDKLLVPEPAKASGRPNKGVLAGAGRRGVAALPPLPRAPAVPAQVQKQQEQPAAKSKAAGAVKKPSQPRKPRKRLGSGPGREGKNDAFVGDMAAATAGPAQSVDPSSAAAGKRRRREKIAVAEAASDYKAASGRHDAVAGGTDDMASDRSHPREGGDAHGQGLLPTASGATTSRDRAEKTSQVTSGSANPNQTAGDEDEDVLAAFDAMFAALKGLNAS